MDPLKDLQDVELDSSPVDDEVEVDDVPEVTAESTEEAKPSRTADQVHGEMDRKFKKLQSQFEKVLERLETQPTTAPSSKTVNPIDQYSIEQLKNFRTELKDENQKAQLEDIIRDREIKEKMSQELGSFRQNLEYTEAKKNADTVAVRRYPSLKDEESEFYLAVKREIRLRGESYVKKNPRAVLDVANEVAIDMGVAPRTKVKGIRGSVATRRNSSTPVDSKDKALMSDEKAKAIAKRLQGALPKGKKFDIDKIKKNHKIYADNVDILTKG